MSGYDPLFNNDRLPGVGANPIPNCKLGFGLRVHSNCVQTLSSLINYVGENELLV